MLHNLPQMRSRYLTDSDFQVLYVEGTDSGGFAYKDILNQVIKRTGLKQNYNHAHEWCCGHGMMGFTLLDSGTCNKLTLSDIDYDCVLGCQITTVINNITDKVNNFLLEEFSDIPVVDQLWDLIITNPPYVPDINFYSKRGRQVQGRTIDMWVDSNWRAHKNFFANVKKYIDSDCDIYMFGISDFSSGQIELAKSNGFKLVQKYDDLKRPSFETVELLHFRPE